MTEPYQNIIPSMDTHCRQYTSQELADNRVGTILPTQAQLHQCVLPTTIPSGVNSIHNQQITGFLPSTVMTTQIQHGIPHQAMIHHLDPSNQHLTATAGQPMSPSILSQNEVRSDIPHHHQQR